MAFFKVFVFCITFCLIFDVAISTFPNADSGSTALTATSVFRLRVKRQSSDVSPKNLCLTLDGTLCGGVATAKLNECATTAGTLRQEFKITDSSSTYTIRLKRKDTLALAVKAHTGVSGSTAAPTAVTMTEYDSAAAKAEIFSITATAGAGSGAECLANQYKLKFTFASSGSADDLWTSDGTYYMRDHATQHLENTNQAVVLDGTAPTDAETQGCWIFDTNNVSS